MEFSAKQIAQLLQGTVEGNPEVTVSNVSKIEEGKPGTLSFLANLKYEQYIYSTQSSIVLVNSDFKAEKPVSSTLIRVKDAYQAFAMLLNYYYQAKYNKTGIENPSYISKTATYGENIYVGAFAYIGENVKIGKNVKIYPHAYIGDFCEIADNTVIYSGVKIYHECKVGANCIIHAGVVIGSDGFGFAPQQNEEYIKVQQIGNVILEDNVEIGANTTIDRATMGSTIIRKGVKLDNLIQVAHNVEIGERTVMAAQSGISGSTKIGKDCMIAGQVGIAGHIVVADEVKIGAQSGVPSGIKEKGALLLGSPAINISEQRRALMVFKSLPEMSRTLHQLSKDVEKLKLHIKE